jgi:hypothetical protein
MLTRKLAASLAVAASLAIVPAAVASPTDPGGPLQGQATPTTGSYAYSLPQLIQRCHMLKDGALIARDWGFVADYLAIEDEYDRLNCEPLTGPLPRWN